MKANDVSNVHVLSSIEREDLKLWPVLIFLGEGAHLPRCALYLLLSCNQMFQYRYLAAGLYLSEAPIPPPPPSYKLHEYITLYLFTQGGWAGEPVRRLEGREFTRGVENTND
jgi:hypothetical protein